MPAKPLVIACLFALHAAAAEEGWRLMAGEPGHDSVIVQARPPAPFRTAATTIAIEIANRAGFDNARYSDWQRLSPEYDFLAHIRLSDLRPATGYVYRPVVRTDTETIVGPVARFTTLPGPHRADPVRFAVVTGMHYHRFHADPDKAYTGPDKPLGYPALATLAGLKPDFVVYTGDNVYYDHPESAPATTRAELRERWRRQFAQPRYTELFLEVPGFWMKDDHDHRYDDSDRSGDRPPSHELGVATFTEQAPIAPRGGGPVRG